MGFFKTLLTGVRDDELDENEREQFQEFQKNELENISKLDIDLILNFISKYANESDLVKIKNAVAVKEDGIEEIEDKISKDEVNEVFNESTEETKLEKSSENEVVEENLEHLNEEEIVVDAEELDDLDESTEIDTNLDEEESINDDKEKEIDSELDLDESDEEYVDLGDDFEESEVSSVNSEESDDESFDDPTLFSVIHDELMELFKEGQVVLLKEEFDFPTLGKRDTLAFGIFNSEISDQKEQTHWFVQNLKQFSRLKECKMLLSEENEKDLILEAGDKHAVLLCFKTNNLVKDEFVFNRKWN